MRPRSAQERRGVVPEAPDHGFRRDVAGACFFALVSAVLLTTMGMSPSFFTWAFERHRNILSWYVRPLFLVPFCLFAYRHSLTGVFATLFLLVTSMFWFPAPAAPDPMVTQFLATEMDYIRAPWSPAKVLSTLLVPLTLSALAAAVWLRRTALGLATLVLIAVLKMVWSVLTAGDAGYSIFVPALIGLGACVGLLAWTLRGKPASRRRRPDGSCRDR